MSCQLHLFGQPRLLIAGEEVGLRPPLAYLVLVALAVGNRSQSRADIAKALFPAVEPRERRAQLRIVLSQLRRRLIELGGESLCRDDGSDLSLDDAVALDAWEVAAGQRIHPNRLWMYAQPVLVGCQSRFANRCRGLVKNTIESSLPDCLASCETPDSLWHLAPTLERLHTLYPLSATICAARVSILRRLHLYQEATLAIAEFETEWVESFGSTDKPDIDSVARQLLPATPPEVRR